MKTKGEAIKEYKDAFKKGTEGSKLLETLQILNTLKCPDEHKALCLKQEIEHIICGYKDSIKIEK